MSCTLLQSFIELEERQFTIVAKKNLALLIYRAVCTRSVNLKYTEVNLKALEGILTPGSFEKFVCNICLSNQF